VLFCCNSECAAKLCHSCFRHAVSEGA